MTDTPDDGDRVLISPAALQAWGEFGSRVAAAAKLIASMRGEPLGPIPEERVEVQPDGTLLVSCEVPILGTVSMSIPADQWAYRQ